MTPNELVNGVGGDTSYVTYVQMTSYYEEVVDMAKGSVKFFWRGVPKGWGSATSTTWKIYWTTDGVGAPVGFNLYTKSGTEGDLVSPGLIPSCKLGCSSSNAKNPLGVGIVNVTTVTLPNSIGSPGKIVEGGIFHIGLDRYNYRYDGTTWIENGNYNGKLYVFGMSVVANF